MTNTTTLSQNSSNKGRNKMKTPTSPRINSKDVFKELDDKLELLASRLDSKETENEIKEFLKFQSKFYNYSFYNQYILHQQSTKRNIKLEKVASFEFWKKQKNDKGERACVKKHSKGFKVFVPIKYTKYQRDEKGGFILNCNGKRIPMLDENGNIIKGLAFNLGNVFDVNQTTAKKLKAYKELEYRNSSTEVPVSSYLELINNIEESFKINIREEQLANSAFGGYCDYKENNIVINSNSDRTTAMKISTLFHELGHSLMHRDMVLNGDLAENELQRGLREGQAEAFSYAVSSYFGIENKSELYIKTWGNNGKELKESIETVSKAIKKAFNKLSLDKLKLSKEQKKAA